MCLGFFFDGFVLVRAVACGKAEIDERDGGQLFGGAITSGVSERIHIQKATPGTRMLMTVLGYFLAFCGCLV